MSQTRGKRNNRIITVNFKNTPRIWKLKTVVEMDKLLPHPLWEARLRLVASYTRGHDIKVSTEWEFERGYNVAGDIVCTSLGVPGLIGCSDWFEDIMEYLLTQENFRAVRERLEQLDDSNILR